MKVFLLSAPTTLNKQVQRSLERLRVTVAHYNERAAMLVPRSWRHAGWAWGLVRKLSPIKRWNNKLFNQDLLRAVLREKPDVFLTTKGTTVAPITLKAMRDCGVVTVNWCLENIYHPTYGKWFRENAGAYDYFLSFDPTVAERFSFFGAHIGYLPFAIDHEDYTVPVTDEDRARFGCDVCFVGAWYPEREELLKAVAGLGVDLKVFGWRQWKDSSLARFYRGPLGLVEMAKAFQCAKICLNSNLLPKNGGANNRTFEILAAGGFELCDDQRDISNLFEVGKEIVTYSSLDDLKEKIRYYLSHGAERAAIAQAGHARIVRDHTFERRMKDLLAILHL